MEWAQREQSRWKPWVKWFPMGRNNVGQDVFLWERVLSCVWATQPKAIAETHRRECGHYNTERGVVTASGGNEAKACEWEPNLLFVRLQREVGYVMAGTAEESESLGAGGYAAYEWQGNDGAWVCGRRGWKIEPRADEASADEFG